MDEGDCLSQDESTWNEELDISQLCRICANPNEYLIPIFQGEGKEHELETKISKHLPIKVSENDALPTNLCYQCASTLIAWHDMVVGCLEADEKLKATSHCKTENSLKASISSEIVPNHTEAENKRSFEESSVSEARINNAAYVFQEQESKLIPSDEIEKVVYEENIAAVKHESMEEKTTDSRCLGSFKTYHQTQVALRMLQWANQRSVFCIICGKQRENQTLLIKHLYIEHKMQCGHCDARFTSEQKLRCHILTHGDKPCLVRKSPGNHNKTIYKANFSFTNKDKRDCDSVLFRCEICSLSFLERFDLKKHRVKCHSKVVGSNKENGDSKTKFRSRPKVYSGNPRNAPDKLVECNRSSSDENIFHMNDSDNSVKDEFTKDLFVKAEIRLIESKFFCTLCDFSCNIQSDLILHEKSVHKSRKNNESNVKKEKPHHCSVCSKSYLRKADLQRHIQKIHSTAYFFTKKNNIIEDMNVEAINRAKENIDGIIFYRCELCGKHLRTKKGFVRHVRVHTGERPFTCHICGKQYRSNTDLTRHLKCVHEGIKKYDCDLCGQSFANKATTTDHRRTHTGEKPFMCDVCGKSFPTPNSIYIHRRIHTNYFPHECNTCEKKFRRKQQLIHHTRTHTGEKPHACDVCGKCFSVKDEVARHKLTHSNEKPHICPNCGFAFAQKRYLTNHMKTHHSGLI